MSAHEIATRARQATGARLDALRHRAGLPPAMPAMQPGYAPDKPGGNFFFNPADVPSLAALWKQLDPAAAAATVARAEQILTRRYPILGYPAVDFGNPVDWQFDPVNQKRAPLIPFVSIPYLDFQVVGDHKVTWELSRHQHLLTLVRAYVFTGDRRFADEALLQWRHWKTANPYPLGINWTSTLEVGFRILSWMWMDHLLAGTPLSTPAVRLEFAQSIGHGAAFIRRYLSTYFAPNTHLLGEAYAMFAAGIIYRDLFQDAPRWAEEGWRIVNEEARNQVLPDGFHFEQSTYYHVYALDFFVHARQLGARNGLDTTQLDAVIPRMAHALATVSQAGQAPRFGDDDGGRLFDPARNRTQHFTDPLATAGAIYGRPDWKALVGAAREETLWLAGADAVKRYQTLQPAPSQPRSEYFPDSGHACLAQAAGVLIADAGPHGWGNGAHGHADALSVQLIMSGEALITDPGTGTYPFDTRARNQLRQTSAHSTLEMDGRGQAEPIGSFKWQRMPRVTLEHFHVAPLGSLFQGSHDGYGTALHPVPHRRVVISWNGSGWLVFDSVRDFKASHPSRLHWPVPPGAVPTSKADGWSIRYASGQTLHLVAINEGWHWEQPEVVDWSPAYGALEPGTDLTYSGALSQSVATVFVPGLNRPALVPLQSFSGYEWRDEMGTRRMWFVPGLAGPPFDTDADFLLVAFTPTGELSAVWLADVKVLAVNGEKVVDSTERIQWIAWQPGDPPPAPNWNPATLAELFRATC